MPTFNLPFNLLFNSSKITLNNEQAGEALLKLYDIFIQEVIAPYCLAYLHSISEVEENHPYEFDKDPTLPFEPPLLDESFFNEGFAILARQDTNESTRTVKSIKNFSKLSILKLPQDSKNATNLTVKKMLSCLLIEAFYLNSEEHTTIKETLENNLQQFFQEFEIEADNSNKFINRKEIITVFIKTLAYFGNNELQYFLKKQWLPELLIKCQAIPSIYENIPEIENSENVIEYINQGFSEREAMINNTDLTSFFIDYLTIEPGFIRCLDNQKALEISSKLIQAAKKPTGDEQILAEKALITESDLINHQEKIITALLESFMKIKDDNYDNLSIIFKDFFTVPKQEDQDFIHIQINDLKNTLLNYQINEKRYKIKTNQFLFLLIDNLSSTQFKDLINSYTNGLALAALENENLLKENIQLIRQNLNYFYYYHCQREQINLAALSVFSDFLFTIYLLDKNFSLNDWIKKPKEVEKQSLKQDYKINYYSLIMNIGSSLKGLKELFYSVELFLNKNPSLEIKANKYKNLLIQLIFLKNDKSANIFDKDKAMDKSYRDNYFKLLRNCFQFLNLDHDGSKVFIDSFLINHLNEIFLSSKVDLYTNIGAELINLALISPCTLNNALTNKLKMICTEVKKKNIRNLKAESFITFLLNHLIERVANMESDELSVMRESNLLTIVNNLITFNNLQSPLYNVNKNSKIIILIKLLEKITEAKINNSLECNLEKDEIKKTTSYLNNIYQSLYENHKKSIKNLLSKLASNSTSHEKLNENLLRLIDNIVLNLPECALELRNIVGYRLPFSNNEINLVKKNINFLFAYVLIPTFQVEQRRKLINAIFTNDELTPLVLELFTHIQYNLTKNYSNNFKYFKIKENAEDLYRNFTAKQRGDFFKLIAYTLAEEKNKALLSYNKRITRVRKRELCDATGQNYKLKDDSYTISHYKHHLVRKSLMFFLSQAGSIEEYPILINDKQITNINDLLALTLQNFPEHLDSIFEKMMASHKIAEQEVTADHLIQVCIAFNNYQSVVFEFDILSTFLKKFNHKINQQDALILLVFIDDFLIKIINELKNTECGARLAINANKIRKSLLAKVLMMDDLPKQLEKNNLNKLITERLEKDSFILKDINPNMINNISHKTSTPFLTNFRNRIIFRYLKNNPILNTTYFDTIDRLNLLVDKEFDELAHSQQKQFLNTLLHDTKNPLLLTDFNKFFQYTNRLSNAVANTLVNKYYSLLFTEENFSMIENEETRAALFLAGYNNLRMIPANQRQKTEKNLEILARKYPKMIATLLSLPLSQDKHHLFNKKQIQQFSKSRFIRHLIVSAPSENTEVLNENSFLISRNQTKLFRNLLVKADLEDSIAKNLVDNLNKNNSLLTSDIVSIFIERIMLNKLPLSNSMAKHLMKKIMTGEEAQKNWLQLANFSPYLEECTKNYKDYLFKSYLNRHKSFGGGKAIFETYSHPLARKKAFMSMFYERKIKRDPEFLAQLETEIKDDETIQADNIFKKINQEKIKTIYLEATNQALTKEIATLVEQQLELDSVEIYETAVEEFMANEENELLINGESISIKNYKQNILNNLNRYQKINSDQIKQFLPENKQYSYKDYQYLTCEENNEESKQALIDHYLNHCMLDAFSSAKENIFLAAHDVDNENLMVRLGLTSNRVNIKHLTGKDYLKINHGKVMNKKENYSELTGETIKEELENKAQTHIKRFTTDQSSSLSLTDSGYFIKGANFNEKKRSLAQGFQHWRTKTKDGFEFKTLSMCYSSVENSTIVDNRKKLELDLQRGEKELPTIDIKFYQLHRYIILAFRKLFNAIAKKLASKAESVHSEENNTSNKLIDWGKNNQFTSFTTEENNEPIQVQYTYFNSEDSEEKNLFDFPLFVSQKEHNEYVTKRNEASNKDTKKQLFEEAAILQSQTVLNVH